MMKYKVMVAGITVGTYNTKKEAEEKLNELKNSYLGMIHPKDTMFIKEVKEES